MDFTAITSTAVNTLVPYLVRAGEKAVEKINFELWDIIKRKFVQRERDEALIELFAGNPSDEKVQAIVEYRLEEYLHEDLEFADTLRNLLENLPKPNANNLNIQRITGTGNIAIQDIAGSTVSINK